MRIAFDVSYIQTKPHGYRRYAAELLHALVEMSHDAWLLHGWSRSLDRRWLESLSREDVKLSLLRIPGQLKRLYWNTMRAPALERLIGTFDIFHSTDPLLPPTRRKAIITIHDLVYRKFPDLVERRVVRWARQVQKNVARADAIVVVSEHTKRDVVEQFSVPEWKVHVIYPILSSIFTNAVSEKDEEILRRYDLLQPYILFVATIEPRKNLGQLLEAYSRLAPSVKKLVPLVVVGRRGWKSEDVVKAVRVLEAKREVRWFQCIPDDELAAFYRHALVVVYPSLYEGFGYPVAEALACGAPVITSNVASLPEIAGQAALLIEPTDMNALVEALMMLINDETRRAELRRLGPEQVRRFSRERSAASMLSLYKNLA